MAFSIRRFCIRFKEVGTNLFLLSIWYDKIPEKTIVWYADEGNTIPRGSKVQLTADRGLVFTNPQGDQELEKGYVLTSRKTEPSFSEGRFQLSMLDNGNLVLRTINLPTDHPNEPYFTSGTRDDNDALNAGSRFVFNQSGYIYVLRANGRSPCSHKEELFQPRITFSEQLSISTVCSQNTIIPRYPMATKAGLCCGLNWKIFAQQVLCLQEVALADITAFASSTRMEGRLVRAHEGIPYLIQVINLVAANRISRRAARMTMNNYMILLSYPTLTGHFLTTCCWSLSIKRSAGILACETACALFPFTEIIAVGRRGYHSQMGELLELKGARHLSKSGKILILPHRVLVFRMRRSR
ncbi:G-type lectin S-receptor-like serine/threonine-protein kinase RLK1 [Cornus florida]|uniref:G-type lectin S-receptor-like serine/threonine-protein kinase RLK1 n=1 Tax=Cornus florida TaxID=4283 RepID=UPI0028A04778|nr:G-type lectin S-receptor-like serine/threonine-protein kinase RLK1 [Cornus florida]